MRPCPTSSGPHAIYSIYIYIYIHSVESNYSDECSSLCKCRNQKLLLPSGLEPMSDRVPSPARYH